jgi:phage tail-like protein
MTGNPPGPLLSHLPGIYHSSEDLRELLAGIETVLFGPDSRALEQQIARIATYFDAAETPEEFLSWLGQWVALSHMDGLSLAQQRQLLLEIVPLYAKRGTKAYLARLLELFSPDGAEIIIEDHALPGLIIGQAKIGIDAWLEADRPFSFEVKVRASRVAHRNLEAEVQRQSEWREWARRVIDLAKPAHTTYDLDWAFVEATDHD